jgi:FMN-dependent NADH-azoreductase
MILLHIDSSILEARSVSRELTASVVRTWRQSHPEGEVIYRDLAATIHGHLSPSAVGTLRFGLPPADQAVEELDRTEELISEFLAADVVVIGAPMYNFGISSQLKSWIDALAQKGRTFSYSEKGPTGLAGGKHVIIVSSRGGIYSSGPMAVMDFQEPYLAAVLKFFGIHHIDLVRAEGVNISPEKRVAAIAEANRLIGELFSSTPERILAALQ